MKNNTASRKLLLGSVAFCGAFSLAQADVSINALQAKTTWKAADIVLNLIYADVKVQQPEAAVQQQLIVDQEHWVTARDSAFGNPEDNSDGQDEATKFTNLLNLTLAREKYLEAYTGNKVQPGLAGEYDDSLGAYLSITASANGQAHQYDVSLVAIRGKEQTFNDAQTLWVVPNDSAAQVADVLQFNNDDGSVCKVSIKRVNQRVDLAADASTRCDAGTAFNGTYLKTVFKNPNAN